jgi:hypothetical protein
MIASLSGPPVTPTGTLGPFTVGANAVLNVHPLSLTSGGYEVRLLDDSGTVDFGLSVHAGTLAYQGKADALAAEWMAPAGEEERLYFTADSAGTYPVVVWKRGSAVLPTAGTYRLVVTPIVLAAPEPAVPSVTGLAHAAPSPFRDRTTLAFDLAAAGQVSIEVFDLTGARVRTLESGWHPAGRHQAVWNGADQDGRLLPAGVYLVCVEAEGLRGVRKVVKLK